MRLFWRIVGDVSFFGLLGLGVWKAYAELGWFYGLVALFLVGAFLSAIHHYANDDATKGVEG